MDRTVIIYYSPVIKYVFQFIFEHVSLCVGFVHKSGKIALFSLLPFLSKLTNALPFHLFLSLFMYIVLYNMHIHMYIYNHKLTTHLSFQPVSS